MNCLSVFDQFVGLALKGLKHNRILPAPQHNLHFPKLRKIFETRCAGISVHTSGSSLLESQDGGKIPPEDFPPPNFYSHTKGPLPVSLHKNFHVITKYKLHLHQYILLTYHFFLISCSIYTPCHANSDFKQCSIFTECCFQHRKRFKWSQSLLIRFTPPNKKNPPAAKFPVPSPLEGIPPLPLTVIWKTLYMYANICSICVCLFDCLWASQS